MDKLLWTIMVYIGFVGRTVVVASGGQSGSALLRGNAAKRLLLRGSIPIGRVGQASGYMKPGGAKRMQEDFLSVRPTGVSEGELPGFDHQTIGFLCDRVYPAEHTGIGMDCSCLDEKFFPHGLPIQRQRRALSILPALGTALWKGRAAKKRIFQGARMLDQEGDVRVYIKTGGIEQMKKDFQSVKPINVKEHEFPGLGRGKVGYVGDRMISYGTTSYGHNKLVLVRRNLDGSPLTQSKIDVILYY